MYLHDLGASLLRRWPLVLVLLALTAGGCALVGYRTPPVFETRASVLLVPPRSTQAPSANRYLLLDGMDPAVDVLTRSLNSDATQEVVSRLEPDGEYTVVADGSTSAPIFIITVNGATRPIAQRTLNAVLTQVPANLDALQSSLGIAPKSLITSKLVAREGEPKQLFKGEIRMLGGLAAGGLLATCVLVAAADSLLLKRREELDRRRQDEVEELPDDELVDDRHGVADLSSSRLR